ncbi:hypothetical protein [Brachybacterium sacelli]
MQRRPWHEGDRFLVAEPERRATPLTREGTPQFPLTLGERG